MPSLAYEINLINGGDSQCDGAFSCTGDNCDGDVSQTLGECFENLYGGVPWSDTPTFSASDITISESYPECTISSLNIPSIQSANYYGCNCASSACSIGIINVTINSTYTEPTCDDESACNDGEPGDCQYPLENYDCDGNCIAGVDCDDVCGGDNIYDGCDGTECGDIYYDCDGEECGDNLGYDCCNGTESCDSADCPECCVSNHCTNPTPHCDCGGECVNGVTSGVCVECLDDNDCGGGTPYCLNGNCVQCIDSCLDECFSNISGDYLLSYNCTNNVCVYDNNPDICNYGCTQVNGGDDFCTPPTYGCELTNACNYDSSVDLPCNNVTENDCCTYGTGDAECGCDDGINEGCGCGNGPPYTEICYCFNEDGNTYWDFKTTSESPACEGQHQCPDDCGLDELSGKQINGCMNLTACNYDETANVDDGSCLTADCNGECGGTAVVDECGVCGGDNTSCADCLGVPNGGAVVDCNGDCNGSAVLDECGECGGDNSSCTDCAGVLNGDSIVNPCGVCLTPTQCDEFANSELCCTDVDSDGICDCIDDCVGTVDDCGVCNGGNASMDNCGLCTNDESYQNVQDCSGECFGDLVLDECGVCGGGNASMDNCGLCTNDESYQNVEDCSGECNGDAVLDLCGVCGGDNSSCLDCAGVPNGNAELDQCGVCNGDGTSCLDECGVLNGDSTSCADCAGTPNGTNWLSDCGCVAADNLGNGCNDDCGVPNGDNTSCADECGVPNGDNSSCTDECGVVNGNNSTCLDECLVPNGDSTSCAGCDDVPNSGLEFDECGECDGDNSSCSDCAGVPYGTAEIDECGVCDGDGIATGACDCDGNSPTDLTCENDFPLSPCGNPGDCNGSGCEGTTDIQCCSQIGSGEQTITGCSPVCPNNYALCSEADYGCMDSNACNYSSAADIDNGSCTYAEENYNCAGNCIVEIDCAGTCGGDAEEDCLGVCGGGSVYNATFGCCSELDESTGVYVWVTQGCDGVCGSGLEYDCAGVCNGTAYVDDTVDDSGIGYSCTYNVDYDGVPGGTPGVNCVGGTTGLVAGWALGCDNICFSGSVEDCNGDCDGDGIPSDCCGTDEWSEDCETCGTAFDACGTCDGLIENLGCGCGEPGPSGCDSECGSELENDCAGVCGGGSYTDECDNCVCGDGIVTNTNGCVEEACVQDCAGVWGGTSYTNPCGDCVTSDTDTCVQDCAGNWGGTAEVDACGVCGGDGYINCSSEEGGCNTPSVCDVSNCIFEDACGVCGGDNSSCADCAGTPNGDAVEDCSGYCGTEGDGTFVVVDACGVCGGDNSTCSDCAGEPNGDAVEDCFGVCNGDAVVDNCGVCDGDGSTCDECSEIFDGITTFENACNFPECNQFPDCTGECGGTAELDDCGICEGDNSSCADCAGTPNGTAEVDCAGVCGGNAVLDGCDVCNGDAGLSPGCCDNGNCSQPTPNCVNYSCECSDPGGPDCAGICGGTAELDQCDVCNGDGTSCLGCTDVSACNYNSEATIDDGKCEYQETVTCYGGFISNYWQLTADSGFACPNTHTDDDCPDDYQLSPDLGEYVGGCTSSGACNYNNLANVNDGSCWYVSDLTCENDFPSSPCGSPGDCDGSSCTGELTFYCFDPQDAANNYANDPSCEMPECPDGYVTEPPLGCTTSYACNYNPGAVLSDGSCTYAEYGFDCNGNCLSDIDCTGDCGGTVIEDCAGVCGGSAELVSHTCYCNFEINGNGIFWTSTEVSNPICSNLNIEDNLSDFNTACFDVSPLCVPTESDGQAVFGCTDPDACNYNEYANSENNSCTYAATNYDCDGNCIAEVDCAGICGGDATEQGCDNACNSNNEWVECWPDDDGDGLGDPTEDSEQHCGSCNSGWVPNNNDLADDCNADELTFYVCDESTPCGGGCDTPCYAETVCGILCGGTGCGICDETPTDLNYYCDGTCGGVNEAVEDCNGVCGGDAIVGCDDVCNSGAVVDDCGVCGGDNSSCTDCSGELNGSNLVYTCGEGDASSFPCGTGGCASSAEAAGCSAIPEGDCDCNGNQNDCSGECGGNGVLDNCGVCTGNDGYIDNCVQGCGGDYSNTGDETQFDCAGVCDGDAVLSGCDNECNSTAVEDCAGECGGDSVLSGCDNECNSTAVEDCFGVCGGDAQVDECEVCDGDGIADGACDCDGNVDLGCGCGEAGPSGCDESCGSTLENDDCGICGGDNSSCSDCDGVPNGSAILCGGVCCSDILEGLSVPYCDECNNCNGPAILGNDGEACLCDDTTQLNADGCCDDVVMGCDDVCGSGLSTIGCKSNAAACNRDSSLDCHNHDDCEFAQDNYDCAGECCSETPNCENISNLIYCCGIPPVAVETDCNGVCGGDYFPEDCNGEVCGSAVVDDCGICGGGNSDMDCAGICFGDAALDDCGVCEGGNANQDCAGVCDGDAVVDDCGVCNGGNADMDCAGVCDGDYVIDECGICGGEGETFDCGDGTMVCNEFDQGDGFSHCDYMLSCVSNNIELNCGQSIYGNDCEPCEKPNITKYGCSDQYGNTYDETECPDGSCPVDEFNYCVEYIGEEDSDCCNPGCTDSEACNYDSEATIDDDSCTYPEINYDCDGECIAKGENLDDDTGLDCNGICGGDAVEDCAGECNGDAELDDCGDCNGDNAAMDECGNCDGKCNLGIEGNGLGDNDCYSECWDGNLYCVEENCPEQPFDPTITLATDPNYDGDDALYLTENFGQLQNWAVSTPLIITKNENITYNNHIVFTYGDLNAVAGDSCSDYNPGIENVMGDVSDVSYSLLVNTFTVVGIANPICYGVINFTTSEVPIADGVGTFDFIVTDPVTDNDVSSAITINVSDTDVYGCMDEGAENWDGYEITEDNGSCVYSHEIQNLPSTLSLDELESSCQVFDVNNYDLADTFTLSITSSDESVCTVSELTPNKNCADEDVNGTYSFDVSAQEINSATSTCTITVTATNDNNADYGPYEDTMELTVTSIVADITEDDITISTHEDVDVDIDLSTYVSNNDDDTITYYISQLPNNGNLLESGVIIESVGPLTGSTITYDPDDDWNGNDSFIFYITDPDDSENNHTGDGFTKEVSIEVIADNDQPLITQATKDALNDLANILEDEETTLSVYAVDVDSDELTWSSTSTNIGLSFNPNPTTQTNGESSLTINPDDNWCGTENVTIEVSDGELTDSHSFDVVVDCVTDSATFTLSSDSISMNQGSSDTVDIDITDVDISADFSDSNISYEFESTDIDDSDAISWSINTNSGDSKSRTLTINSLGTSGYSDMVTITAYKYLVSTIDGEKTLQNEQDLELEVTIIDLFDEVTVNPIDTIEITEGNPVGTVDITLNNIDDFNIAWPTSTSTLYSEGMSDTTFTAELSSTSNTGATVTVTGEDEAINYEFDDYVSFNITYTSTGFDSDGSGEDDSYSIPITLSVHNTPDVTNDIPEFSIGNFDIYEYGHLNLLDSVTKTINVIDRDPGETQFNFSLTIESTYLDIFETWSETDNGDGTVTHTQTISTDNTANPYSELTTDITFITKDVEVLEDIETSASLTISDSEGNSTTTPFTITVKPYNDPHIIEFVGGSSESNTTGTINLDEGDAASDHTITITDAEGVVTGYSLYIDDNEIMGNTTFKDGFVTFSGSPDQENNQINISIDDSEYCGTTNYTLKVSDSDYDANVSFDVVVACINDEPTFDTYQTVHDLNEDFGQVSIDLQLIDPDVVFGDPTHEFTDISIQVSNSRDDLITANSYSVSSESGAFSLHLESIENVNSGNDFDPETASDNSDRADITITLTDPNDNSLQSTHHLYIGVIAVDDPTVMDLIESPVQVNQGETVTIEGISAQDPDNDIDHFEICWDESTCSSSQITDSNYEVTLVGESNPQNDIQITSTNINHIGDTSLYVRACTSSDSSVCSEPELVLIETIDIYLGFTFDIKTAIEDVTTTDNVEVYLDENEDGTHPAGISENTAFFSIFALIDIDSGFGLPNITDFTFTYENTDYISYINHTFDDFYINGQLRNVRFDIYPDNNAIITENHLVNLIITANDGISESNNQNDSIEFTLLYTDCNDIINGSDWPDICNVCAGDNTCDGEFDAESNQCLGIWDGSGFDCAGFCGGSNQYFSGGGSYTNSSVGLIANPNSTNWLDVGQENIVDTIYNFVGDYYTAQVQYGYNNYEIFEGDNNLYQVLDSFTCCSEAPVLCCLDLDDSGFCDLDNFDIPLGDVLGYPITLDNSNGLLYFCGQCPESDGWITITGPDVPGCMDVEATNYDENATINDGSCIYYDGGTLKVSTAPTFGVIENAYNIYPRGHDTRKNIRVSYPYPYGLSCEEYYDDCIDTGTSADTCEIVFGEGACIDGIPSGLYGNWEIGNGYELYESSYLSNQNEINPNYRGFVYSSRLDEYGELILGNEHNVGEIVDEFGQDWEAGSADTIYYTEKVPSLWNQWQIQEYNIEKYNLQIFKEGTDEPIFEKDFIFAENINSTYSDGSYTDVTSENSALMDFQLIYSLGEENAPQQYFEYKQFVAGDWFYIFEEGGNYRMRLQAFDSDGAGDMIVYYPSTRDESGELIEWLSVEENPLEQSFLNSYLPYQGIDLEIGDVEIANMDSDRWDTKDNDERKPLGCFNYSVENQSQNFWPFGDTESGWSSGFSQSDSIEIDEWKRHHIVDVDVRMYKRRGVSYSNLFYYWDEDLHPDNYNETTAPLDVQFYFYPRPSKNEDGEDYTFFDEKPIPDSMMYDFRDGYYYVTMVDWGDGSPKEYDREPLKLGYNVIVKHNYERAGIYEITGYLLRMNLNVDNDPSGVISNTKFTVRININPEREDEFEYLGGTGYSFIPYQDTTPIIGGISQNSLYYNSISRQLGFLEGGDGQITTYFDKYSDRVNSENALYLMDDTNLGVEIEKYQTPIDDIFSGLYNNAGELGSSIGFTDIQLPRFFNQPKQMWEMLGFEDNVAGKPDELRYWKNIIPEDYDIYTDRYGVGRDQLAIDIVVMYNSTLGNNASYDNVEQFFQGVELPDSDSVEYICDQTDGCDDYWRGLINDGLNSDISVSDNLEYYDTNGDGVINVTDIIEFVNRWQNFTGEQVWNINNNQSWIGGYYYPVLPKFKANGSFSDDLGGKIPFGTPEREWNGDDESAAITNEQYQDNSLLLNYTSEYLDKGVLEDTSGYDNIGMCMNDYRVEYDEKTIQPIKKNRKFKLNVGKNNKAF